MKDYDELTFNDDFMFGKVTRNLNITKQILEMATGQHIDNIKFAENQKTIEATIEGKDVRLDSYVEDNKHIVYNSEMQNQSSEDSLKNPQLPKRSRYYQGMIDIHVLEGGAKYQNLKESYVIFFCTFDPFGKGYYRYTFRNICDEDSSLRLDDGCIKIFFNSKGTIYGDAAITEEQRAFLDYLETGIATDKLTKDIDNEVRIVRSDRKWRRDYMKELIVFQEHEDIGEARGEAKGRRLATIENIISLLEDIDTIPLELEKKIYAQEDLNTLKSWHKFAARSDSIEEFEAKISQ